MTAAASSPWMRLKAWPTHLKKLLSHFFGLCATRVELAAIELAELRALFFQGVLLAILVGIFGLAGLGLFSFLILFALPEAFRWVGGLCLLSLYGGLAIFFFWKLLRLIHRAPPPFEATLAEFKKDHAHFFSGHHHGDPS